MTVRFIPHGPTWLLDTALHNQPGFGFYMPYAQLMAFLTNGTNSALCIPTYFFKHPMEVKEVQSFEPGPLSGYGNAAHIFAIGRLFSEKKNPLGLASEMPSPYKQVGVELGP